jgi:hypothetical protein
LSKTRVKLKSQKYPPKRMLEIAALLPSKDVKNPFSAAFTHVHPTRALSGAYDPGQEEMPLPLGQPGPPNPAR